MKAERRHELKENSLVRNLEQAPAFFQVYGSRLLLGLVVTLLVIVLVRNHFAEQENRKTLADESLGDALYSLSLLRNLYPFSPPGRLAQDRNLYASNIDDKVSVVLDKSQDPAVRAQAYVVRGDLNWLLANFPTLPTTNPDEKFNVAKSSEELLKTAEQAYTDALNAAPSQGSVSVAAARFGLAAIAENRSQWDKAAEQFQKILDNPALGPFHETAQADLLGLKTISKPVLLGVPPAAPTLGPVAPSFTPSTSRPSSVLPSPSDLTGPSTFFPPSPATPGQSTPGQSTPGPIFPAPANPSTNPTTDPSTDHSKNPTTAPAGAALPATRP